MRRCMHLSQSIISNKFKMWRTNLAILLLIIFPVLGHGSPIVPCYFIFGDSLSDAGNNNALVTAAKANYSPYGIDFPGGTTGRFTNGRTNVDVLTKLLGFKGYIPPFSSATGSEILKGVNYASGSAGIRQETGSHLGDRISLDRQLQNHMTVIANLQSLVQGPVSDYLSKCLYTLDIGSNDYLNNYFMPQYYPTQSLFNIEQYATQLAAQYYQQLKALYDSGARKVAIFGVAQLGCIPQQIASNNATQCVDKVNQAVKLFNQELASVVDQINSQLPGAKFTFIDTYAMQVLIPPGVSSLIASDTCCKLRSDYQCEPSVRPCLIRSLHAFMDGFHPTEVVNVLRATTAFTTVIPKFARPVNIGVLVASEAYL